MSANRKLNRSASFWVAAAVVAHTLWTSAAPAMSYRLYALEWHLTPTATTGIFAVYPIVVVAVLVLFGDISDYIGRRVTMLLGLAASLTGVLMFAVALNIGWIFIGRAFMGIGVGLSASAAAAAIVEYSPEGHSKKASTVTTFAQAVGLALAMLLGGALIQYAPYPLHLNFLVLSAVLTILFAATYFLPRGSKDKGISTWRPKGPIVHKSLRKDFVVSVTAVTSAYSLGGVILSLGGQIAHDLVGSSNTLVNGTVMAVFAIVVGVAAIGGKSLSSRKAIRLGGFFALAGMLLMTMAVSLHALSVFLLSIAASGASYSLMFLGGLRLINEVAPAHHRGGTVSAVYLVAYLFQGSIAFLLGLIATQYGLGFAIDAGSIFLAALSTVAIFFSIFIGNNKAIKLS